MSTTRRDEFAQLIATHQSQIYGFVRTMVRSSEDAQDLHQQAMLVLWKKFDQFEMGTNFLAWALRVAELEVRSFRRRRQPINGLSDEVFTQLAHVLQAEAVADGLCDRKVALEDCLAKLSPDDRSLIGHVYAEGQRIKKVAERLDRLPQSISNSLRRIRRALFECIESSLARYGRQA